MMRKKVLVFNGYYIPAKKYGGPTTSLASIVENCSDLYEFYIVAANHDLNDNNIFDGIHDGWNKVGEAKVLYIDLSLISYHSHNIRRLLMNVNPDLVWLVGILVPGDKWFVSRECRKMNIPYLISPRGEVCENTFHMKYYKKKIVSHVANILNVYKNAFFHATSIEEKEGLIKYFNADDRRIFMAPNIPAKLKASRRVIAKESGEIKVVFISRIQEKKNLLTAIQAVNRVKGKVVFDIYGPIESEIYWNECLNEIKKANNNVSIKYCGALSPEKVHDAFLKYHCFLFPTISENYGHVIVEALFSDCPIVLSKGTTPWDDINEKGGYTCDLNNVVSFTKALEKICRMEQSDYNDLLENTKGYFDKKMQEDDAVNKHKKMLNQIIDSTQR